MWVVLTWYAQRKRGRKRERKYSERRSPDWPVAGRWESTAIALVDSVFLSSNERLIIHPANEEKEPLLVPQVLLSYESRFFVFGTSFLNLRGWVNFRSLSPSPLFSFSFSFLFSVSTRCNCSCLRLLDTWCQVMCNFSSTGSSFTLALSLSVREGHTDWWMGLCCRRKRIKWGSSFPAKRECKERELTLLAVVVLVTSATSPFATAMRHEALATSVSITLTHRSFGDWNPAEFCVCFLPLSLFPLQFISIAVKCKHCKSTKVKTKATPAQRTARKKKEQRINSSFFMPQRHKATRSTATSNSNK